MGRPLEVVTFDGDGTLWDYDSAMGAALRRSAQTLTTYGFQRRGKQVEPAWLAEVREEVAARPEMRSVSMESIRLASFQEAIDRCNRPRGTHRKLPGDDLAASICSQYMVDRFRELAFYSDVQHALEFVTARYRCALITNGNTHASRKDLLAPFEHVIVAFDVGVQKPDPAIYEIACKRMGADPRGCLHVGNDPLEDAHAAGRAGMHAIWLNRSADAWPTELGPPPVSIATLASLPEFLGDWDPRAAGG